MTLRRYLLYLSSLLFLLTSLSTNSEAIKFSLSPAASSQAGSSAALSIQTLNDNDTVNNTFAGMINLSATTTDGQPVKLTPTALAVTFGVWSGTITYYTAGNINLTCAASEGATGTASTVITPLEAKRLLVVLPGQTYTPGFNEASGYYPGVSPYPTNATILVGSYYPVTAYVTDIYYNWLDYYGTTISLGASGMNPLSPLPTTDGRGLFTVSFTIDGMITLNATANTLSAYVGTPTTYPYVNVADASQAWVHLFTPSQIVAGTYFSVTAHATTSQADPYAILPTTNAAFDLARISSAQPATGTWVGPTTFTISGGTGKYYGHNYAYQKAETLYLRADVTGSPQPPNITGLLSSAIEVLPDVPAASRTQYSLTPSQIQAKHTARINVYVRDQYGNPTRSSLYPFVVNFTQTTGNGYLSVSQTATDANGYTYCDYTGGNVNELAQVQIEVKNTTNNQTYATMNANVQVSVAKVEVGAITNYPNPFNPGKGQTTSINYYLESPSNVDIKIYDPFGRLVLATSLSKDDASVSRSTSPGGASWMWDGRNGAGKVVGNGIYLVKIIAHGEKEQEFKRRVGVLK